MKFTKKISLVMVTIMLITVCSGFADAKTNKKFFDALKKGDGKTVETMLKKDKKLANIEDGYRYTPLMSASVRNYEKITEILIANGADVNASDKDGWTALMYAAFKGNANIVKLLLEKGADVTIKNNDGETSIMIASGKGYKDVEELLISSLSSEQKAAIEKERQEAEELARKEAEEKERQEREAKMRHRAEDFVYGITDDGKGIRITGLKKYDEDVMIKIPATIEGFPVTEVSLWRSHTQSITLIGFERPSNIKKIEFHNGIVDCDLNLPNCRMVDFSECTFKNTTLAIQKEWSGVYLNFSGTNIEKVVVLEGVVKLEGKGFHDFIKRCEHLKTVVFPKTLKCIDESEYFYECYNLKEIVIPKELNKIEFPDTYDYSKGMFECCNLPIATQARLRQLGYTGRF